jgi:putative PIG3 family NAD(P)H quinone oxidoreductase
MRAMPRAKAVRIRGPGDVDVLELGEIEVRDPGPGELSVEVAAAGLNRADLLQRMGVYPAPPGSPPDVPGLEYAGTVAATGEGVSAFRPGDRVMGIVGGGGMASRVVVHEREAIPVPAGMSITDAAALPEVFITAYDALFLQCGLALGQVVLVHAVASGVGTAALQLVKAAGATSVGTSRSKDKLERCRPLGLDHAVVAAEGRFADRVRELAGEPHVVLDLVGGGYLEESFRVVAPRGRIIVVGLLAGANAPMPLGLLLRKRVTLIGTVLRSRPLEEKAVVVQAFIRDVLPLLAAGRVKPVVDDVLPMSEIAEAHRRMGEDRTFGKLVLRW